MNFQRCLNPHFRSWTIVYISFLVLGLVTLFQVSPVTAQDAATPPVEWASEPMDGALAAPDGNSNDVMHAIGVADGTSSEASASPRWPAMGPSLVSDGASEYSIMGDDGTRDESVLQAGPSSKTVLLRPTKDAHILQDSPQLNKGSDPYLVVSSYPRAACRVLIQFDLSSIPSSAQVLSARLRLYKYSTDFNPTKQARVYSIHRVQENWQEDKVTWQGAPRHFDSETDRTEVDWFSIASSGPQYEEWNVQADVASFVRSGSNYGWIIKEVNDTQGSANNKTQFFSREYGLTWNGVELQPALEVQYTERGGESPYPTPTCPTGWTKLSFTRDSAAKVFRPAEYRFGLLVVRPLLRNASKPWEASLTVLHVSPSVPAPQVTLHLPWRHVYVDPDRRTGSGDEYWSGESPNEARGQPIPGGAGVRVSLGWTRQMVVGNDEWQFCAKASDFRPGRQVNVESIGTSDLYDIARGEFAPNQGMKIWAVVRNDQTSVVRASIIFERRTANGGWQTRAQKLFDLSGSTRYKFWISITPQGFGFDWTGIGTGEATYRVRVVVVQDGTASWEEGWFTVR